MAIGRFGDEDDDLDAQENGMDGETDQLDLDEPAEQLPWLESDEDYDQPPVDTVRIAAFAIIGLLAIGLVVGSIWWFTRDRVDPALLADGSIIEAPEGPYKTRPEDPGGKTFDGTGDTSFAVAQGQTREGQIAAEPVLQKTQPAAAPASPDGGEAAESGLVGVQVGAYSTRSGAEQGWSRLVSQYSDLQGLRHRIVEGQADIGTVYRLQALTSDANAADELCNRLKAAGGACQVKR